MTTEEIVNYYADLLILQYLEKPRAYETIRATIRPFIMDQISLDVQNAFAIDTAVGVQLDVIGKYVGANRMGVIAGGVTITLTDSDYRSLIKMAIVKNNHGSSLYDIQNLLNAFFPGQIFAFDLLGMRMSYFIVSSAASLNLIEIFISENFLPKPMGVQVASIVYLPTIDDLFGFRTYSRANLTGSPFNDYADYQTDWPWLSYQDTISI